MIPADIPVSLWYINLHCALCGHLALPLSLPARDQGAERRKHHHGAKGESWGSEGGFKKGKYYTV